MQLGNECKKSHSLPLHLLATRPERTIFLANSLWEIPPELNELLLDGFARSTWNVAKHKTLELTSSGYRQLQKRCVRSFPEERYLPHLPKDWGRFKIVDPSNTDPKYEASKSAETAYHQCLTMVPNEWSLPFREEDFDEIWNQRLLKPHILRDECAFSSRFQNIWTHEDSLFR